MTRRAGGHQGSTRAPKPPWDGATTAQRIYERVFRTANAPGATAQDRAALAAACRLVRAEQEEHGRAVDRALAREQQTAADARRRTRYRQVRAALDRQYGDLGPQYAMLADSLARAVAWAEQADAAGDPTESAAWDREVRAGVAALQRYTESTQETIIRKRVNEKVGIVLEIIEQVIEPQAPELWAQTVAALAERVPRVR
jgi:hypothetical protein